MWGASGLPHITSGRWNGTATSEHSLAVPYEGEHSPVLWPSHSPLVCLPGEMRTSVHTNTCVLMVLAALFIMAKEWKRPKCLHSHPGPHRWQSCILAVGIWGRLAGSDLGLPSSTRVPSWAGPVALTSRPCSLDWSLWSAHSLLEFAPKYLNIHL